MTHKLSTVFSNLFRLSTAFYLRLIPISSFAKVLLPLFFVAHIVSVFLPLESKPALSQTNGEVVETKVDEKVDEKPVEDAAKPAEEPTKPAEEIPADVVVAVPKPPPTTKSDTLDVIATVVFTFPTTSPLLKIVSIALNTILLLLAADFTFSSQFKSYSPTFTRVGAVDHSSAKVVVRYPNLHEGQLRVVWQKKHVTPHENEGWRNGPVLDIEEDKDWVATGKITGLWPSSAYTYRLAHLNGTLLSYPAEGITFRTSSDPRSASGSHFRFLFSSCLQPNFPYNPLYPERIKGLDILANWLEGLQKPRKLSTSLGNETIVEAVPEPLQISPDFLILAGDNIYADVPHYAGGSVENYQKLYRRIFASNSFRRVYENLPIIGMYDDHEFINNYAGHGNPFKQPYLEGSIAFDSYFGNGNHEPRESGVHYFDFRHGDTAFFVLDTRLYRTGTVDDPEVLPSMLGEKQLQALHAWIGQVNTTTTFKFIISSVPFTSLWEGLDGKTETWAAYMLERETLLDVLQYVPNVVFLSGDRHEFGFIEHRGKIPEVSISPLSGFSLASMTLVNQSKKTFEKVYFETSLNDSVIQLAEHIPYERRVAYLPSGNYKFGSFEVDTRDWRRPTLLIEAIISGKTAYKFEFVGEPVSLSFTNSITASLGGAVKEVFGKIGALADLLK